MELEIGRFLVRKARQAIETYLAEGRVMDVKSNDPELDKELDEERGVFTTLRTYPGNALRGCIGFPYPIMPLRKALVESAISAATKDPRFPAVAMDEMDSIVVEVTVLSVPSQLKCKKEDIPKRIKIGRHGLIIELGPYSGLLLPQVPEEVGWTRPEEFLEGVCEKAGLPRDAWKDPNARVYVFEGEVFEEVEPRGEVVRKATK